MTKKSKHDASSKPCGHTDPEQALICKIGFRISTRTCRRREFETSSMPDARRFGHADVHRRQDFVPFCLVHLGSPWNAALTFKKKSGRLPPRKKIALTPNFRQIQVTREEPRKKDERYDQYCRATFQISRSMARLPDHFFQDSSLARRWQEDSHS